jgi:hypothetical protein
MEPDPRTPSGAHRLRLLNEPAPVELRLEEGRPAALRDHRRGRWRVVERVEEVWRLEDGWWRERGLLRTYFRLLLADGDLVTVYQEGNGPRWWLQRYS